MVTVEESGAGKLEARASAKKRPTKANAQRETSTTSRIPNLSIFWQIGFFLKITILRIQRVSEYVHKADHFEAFNELFEFSIF